MEPDENIQPPPNEPDPNPPPPLAELQVEAGDPVLLAQAAHRQLEAAGAHHEELAASMAHIAELQGTKPNP